MIRSAAEAVKAYLNASEQDRARLLVRLSYDLTITARDVQNAGEADRIKRLQGVCEVQHVALSQALAYQARNEHRYPEEEVIPILVQTAERFGLSNHVQHSIAKFFG